MSDVLTVIVGKLYGSFSATGSWSLMTLKVTYGVQAVTDNVTLATTFYAPSMSRLYSMSTIITPTGPP